MTATRSPAALVRVAVRSAAGTRGRGTENHDRAIADVTRGLVIVADGMGGLPAAGAAAELAVSVAAEFVAAGSDIDALRDAVRAAGRAVSNLARTAGVDRSGTTLCAAVLHGSQLLVAHLGDSRAYLLRDGTATALTVDHTPAARLIADGTIEADSQAARDLARTLDRFVGRGDSEPEVAAHEIRAGDRLLFCTDGVHAPLSHETLADLLLRACRPGQVAEELIDAARDAGGSDDATAVVADVGTATEDATALTSPIGGVVLTSGEVGTVGRAGHGADIGFDDETLHRMAARISGDDSGWQLENTGTRLHVVVRDRRSPMSSVTVPPLNRMRIWFAESDVVFTTRRGEHSVLVDCPAIARSGPAPVHVVPHGTGYAYAFDRSSGQFRTLVAMCQPLLRGQHTGRKLSDKAIYRCLREIEPDVGLKAVSRRIDMVCEKILGPGLRDARGAAERAIVTGTVTLSDLKLLRPSGEDGTSDTSPSRFDPSSAEFRTLVAMCEPLLRGGRPGRRLSDKALHRRLLQVEPTVTHEEVSRCIAVVCETLLEPGARDLRAAAEEAVRSGTVVAKDLALIERKADAPG